jgi:hypothetical protein
MVDRFLFLSLLQREIADWVAEALGKDFIAWFLVAKFRGICQRRSFEAGGRTGL